MDIFPPVLIGLPFVWAALWAWRNRQELYIRWLIWRVERLLKSLDY